MAMEWTLTAAVGLMVGISVGVLIQLKYVVMMDKKLEHVLQRVARIELRTEQELLRATKGRRTGSRPVRKAKKVKKKSRRKAKKKGRR